MTTASGKTQHTAGGWFISDEGPGNSDAIRQEETGALICEFPYGAFDGVEGANARLIAAAPALLEAAQALFECGLLKDWNIKGSERQLSAMKAARAAISAATGEAP